jgi:hypothetical protein
MRKRTPVKIGDDAFFSTPSVQEHSSQPATLPASQQAGKTVRPQLTKATFYITDDQDTALEELRLQRRKAGEKIDKSGLIREAIDLLVKQHDGIPVKR